MGGSDFCGGRTMKSPGGDRAENKSPDFSFSAWAVGGGRRADFTEGPQLAIISSWLSK